MTWRILVLGASPSLRDPGWGILLTKLGRVGLRWRWGSPKMQHEARREGAGVERQSGEEEKPPEAPRAGEIRPELGLALGRAKAACGPCDLCPPPQPPNENLTTHPPITVPGGTHCNLGRAGAGACLLTAPQRPPSCLPDSLQPSRAPLSPGRRPSSLPARPARPLPICRRAQGESAGSQA